MTCASWDNVWIPFGGIDWLKLDGRCIPEDVYGDFGNLQQQGLSLSVDLEANEV